MYGIVYLSSMDTGTSGGQFDISSELHLAGMMLIKSTNMLFLKQRLNPGPSLVQANTLPLTHQREGYTGLKKLCWTRPHLVLYNIFLR